MIETGRLRIRGRLVAGLLLAVSFAASSGVAAGASPAAADSTRPAATTSPTSQPAQAAAAENPLVRAALEQNAAFARDLSQLADRLNDVHDQILKTAARYRQIHRSFELTRQQLQTEGMGTDMADVLRQERADLPDPDAFRRQALDLRVKINQARAERLRVDHEEQGLDDVNLQISRLTSQKPGKTLSPRTRAEAARELPDVLAQRREVLAKLSEAYAAYVDSAGEMQRQLRALAGQVDAYLQLLNERLLWIPNASVVGTGWVKDLAASAVWLGSPTRWAHCGRALLDQVIEMPLVVFPLLAAFLALLAFRRRFRRRLDAIADTVEKGYADSFALTLRALLLTLLVAGPWPLILWLAGWLLGRAGSADHFAGAAGAGLVNVAILLLILVFLRRLCRDRGLADAHFRWPPAARRALLLNLGWLIAVEVPVGFVVSLTEATGNDTYVDGIGRLAFLTGSAALALFAQRILRPHSSVLAPIYARSPDGWAWKLRYVWLTLGVAVPLGLAGLAMYGYYYAALAVEGHLFMSVQLAVGAVILHNLIVRWLTVAQRRLAMQQAREKREAAQNARAAKEAAEAAGEGAPQALDVPQVDIATINEHTRALLRFLIGVLMVVGLWAIWGRLVPALGVLKEVTLWQYTTTAGGQEQVVPITLASLGLALVLLVVTFVAARNLTGVLEIALLQRISLDAGLRYAISRVSRYVIITIGLVAMFDAVGIGWSQVQWLVAAIGVGLGFGLQEIFANFVSGLIILFERPLRIGDFVTVGDLSGTVTRIRMRATTLTDWDNKEIIVPNKTFITDRLINWTLSDSTTRLVVKIGIAYGSDTALAQKLLTEAAAANPMVLREPAPSVFFVDFGDSSLDFELRVFVKEPISRWPVLNALHLAIDESFRKHQIEIPFPQRDLHLRSSDVAVAADARPEPSGNGQ